MLHATTCVNPEIIRLSGRRQTQRATYVFHLYEIFSIRKYAEMVVARGWKEGIGSGCFMGLGFSFGVMKMSCATL